MGFAERRTIGENTEIGMRGRYGELRGGIDVAAIAKKFEMNPPSTGRQCPDYGVSLMF
jgi:hypothetical protein